MVVLQWWVTMVGDTGGVTVSKPNEFSVDKLANCSKVANLVKGTSPYRIRVVPSAARFSKAIITA